MRFIIFIHVKYMTKIEHPMRAKMEFQCCKVHLKNVFSVKYTILTLGRLEKSKIHIGIHRIVIKMKNSLGELKQNTQKYSFN